MEHPPPPVVGYPLSYQGVGPYPIPAGSPILQPAGTRVSIAKRAEGLHVIIPPAGFTFSTVSVAVFAFLWNAILWTVFWQISERFDSMKSMETTFAFFVVGIMGLVGLWLIWKAFLSFTAQTEVFLNPDDFFIKQSIGKRELSLKVGRTADICGVKMRTDVSRSVDKHNHVSESVSYCCEIVEGVTSHKFGNELKPIEIDWIAKELSAYLHSLQGGTNSHGYEENTYLNTRAPFPSDWKDASN